MVKAVCFTREHIEKIRSGFTVDNSILERSIFALALLEALANTIRRLVDMGILILSSWNLLLS